MATTCSGIKNSSGTVLSNAFTPATHNHTSDSWFTTALAGKAASSHTHAQSDITNLTTALASKANIANPTFTGTVCADVIECSSTDSVTINDWEAGEAQLILKDNGTATLNASTVNGAAVVAPSGTMSANGTRLTTEGAVKTALNNFSCTSLNNDNLAKVTTSSDGKVEITTTTEDGVWSNNITLKRSELSITASNTDAEPTRTMFIKLSDNKITLSINGTSIDLVASDLTKLRTLLNS